MRKRLIYVLFAALLAAAIKSLVAADQPAFDVVGAFKHLSGPDAIYPNGISTDDRRALQVLNDHPQEVKPLVVAMLSKGGQRGRVQVEWMISLVPRGEALPLARKIVATYPIGDPTTPLLGLLMGKGESQDMLRVKQEIAFAPDSERSIEWAKVMIELENPLVHQTLEELRRTTPGKWKESRELEAYFAKAAATKKAVQGAPPSVKTDSVPTPSPETHRGSNSEPAHIPSNPETPSRFIWWVLGAIAVIATAFFIKTRR